MKGFGARASVADAETLIATRVKALGTERVSFRAALSRVLAENVVSDRNIPPHPRSAMDGYAVRAADLSATGLPARLKVIAELTAAATLPTGMTVEAGQAVRIMTGARIPPGADAVVMVEDTKVDGDGVLIERSGSAGQHILETGSDLLAGQTVLAAGRKLMPQDVSMLVSIGALEVSVQRRPRVRIVPTGNELVRAGTAACGSEIVESNSYLLEGLALRDGAAPELHPIVPDDREMIRRAISAPGADVVVVTGGSSVGTEDFPPVVLREIGELPIHGIDVKPASPTGIGFVGSTVVVLAPGYPVASYVAWDLFVRPIVQRMLSLTPNLSYRTVTAKLSRDYKKPEKRVEIMRVVLENGTASILPGGAALLSTVTRADGFIYFPAGTAQFAAGSAVEVHLYAQS
jgi:molybdopterin molybdotransferase